MPMRRWPRPIRCSVAVMPPAQFEMPTDGVPGSGAVGSTMTTGRPSAFSRSRCCDERSAKTSITPSPRPGPRLLSQRVSLVGSVRAETVMRQP